MTIHGQYLKTPAQLERERQQLIAALTSRGARCTWDDVEDTSYRGVYRIGDALYTTSRSAIGQAPDKAILDDAEERIIAEFFKLKSEDLERLHEQAERADETAQATAARNRDIDRRIGKLSRQVLDVAPAPPGGFGEPTATLDQLRSLIESTDARVKVVRGSSFILEAVKPSDILALMADEPDQTLALELQRRAITHESDLRRLAWTLTELADLAAAFLVKGKAPKGDDGGTARYRTATGAWLG